MRRLAAIIVIVFLPTVTAATASTYRSSKSLEAQARYVALHGGIQGSCWGCATPAMKWYARQLVTKQFSRAGSVAVHKALCIIHREAGENPGAINSRSGAAGLFQFLGHSQYNSWGLKHDPVYQVQSAWRMSQAGTHWSDWDPHGQTYNC